MKKTFTFILVAVALIAVINSSKNSSAFNKSDGDEPEIVSSDHLTMAVLYQQTAAEYRALCYQAFNVAKYQVDQSMRIAGLQKQQAVVVDIDETVLDNSPHEAKCILNNSLYPAYWEEWMNAANAQPVPGAKEFLEYAESKGFKIFYITNRAEKYREQTLKNLKLMSFPQATTEQLFMKKDESSKKARRDKVGAAHEIILLIGDNLNDFSELFEKKSIEDRFKQTDEMEELFGKRFIVLPNAMYGEWEGALYNYDYSITPAQKNEVRNQKLQGF